VNGTASNPVVIRENTGSPAIVAYGSADDVQPTACSINYTRFYNLNGGAFQEATNRAFLASVTNSIIANANNQGLYLAAAGTTPDNGEATSTVTIDNDIFHACGGGATPANIYGGPASNRSMEITNSIFTGSATNGVVNDGTGVYNISNSILSLTGPNALLAATSGAGTINVDGSVSNVQVDYVNMDDPFSPDFFKVVQAAVGDWNLY